MGRRPSPTLTTVELEFMQVLWARGELSTEEVQHALRAGGHELSDGSVRKVLAILMRKGYVTRTPSGRGFRYRARVDARRARGSLVLDLLKRAFGGSAALMLAAIIDARAVKKSDLAEIRRLIAEREVRP